jgi:putative transposase
VPDRVDDFSRECVDSAVDYGIGAEYVTQVLEERVAQFRGCPRVIRTDQGPEFTSRAFMAWARARGIQHLINDAGKPTQNAYVESFNGKFRDECLNEQWFESLHQARQEVTRWRRDYSESRPHSSIGRIPPARFAALHRQRAGDARQSPEVS